MKKIFLILVAGILLGACSKETVLDRTIFIPDEKNAELPAYSEWGYNSFGAKYERDYFRVSSDIVPCKFVYSNNQLQFLLSGKVCDEEKMSLLFIFPSGEMRDYTDLMSLHNSRIDLSADDCIVKMTQNGVDTTLNIVDGTLFIKRAQLLSIDDKENRIILSGFFDLRFLENGFPSTISDGRFDMGITKNVFYQIN